MDLRPAMDPIFGAFGLPATLTPPGGLPRAVRAVWITLQTVEAPIGGGLRMVEQERRLALRRAEVPEVPRGTFIVVAERDGQAQQEWRVEGFGRLDSELIEVLVVPSL